MPAYTFVCKTCQTTREVIRPMKDHKKRVRCNNRKCKRIMHRDFQADFGKQHFGEIWPMASYAAGVHHKQIPEMREIDRKAGVPTDYTPDGDPLFRGPKHRRKYCEVHGLFDRNAGHSDPVPARCR